jgi:hypothetical protein
MIGLPSLELQRGANGCIQQWISILQSPGIMHRAASGRWDAITDHPECTNAVITAAAIRLNDRLSDRDRQALWLFVPRINEARKTSADRRVNVRLAIWCAESVFDLVQDEAQRAKARKEIDAAKGWLDDPTVAVAYADANADAAYIAIRAGGDAAIDWFSRLLDAHEKACADEGVLHEIEAAMCFVGSQWGGS